MTLESKNKLIQTSDQTTDEVRSILHSELLKACVAIPHKSTLASSICDLAKKGVLSDAWRNQISISEVATLLADRDTLLKLVELIKSVRYHQTQHACTNIHEFKLERMNLEYKLDELLKSIP